MLPYSTSLHEPAGHYGRLISMPAALILVVLLFLSGCSHNPEPELDTSVTGIASAAIASRQAGDGERGWWYVSIHWRWPEEQPTPDWYLDGLLANQLFYRILEAREDQFELWRFHRRAVRDRNGHRFSFIFFTTPAIAAEINQQVAADPLVLSLLEQGVIENISYDDTGRIQRPGLAATSDPAWPGVIQQRWPSFIMGSSRMWLGLVHDSAEQIYERRQPDIASLYREVDQQVSELWRVNGQHALLHHLNALFGYQELLLLERKATRF